MSFIHSIGLLSSLIMQEYFHSLSIKYKLIPNILNTSHKAIYNK
jgi:hypothetical protein